MNKNSTSVLSWTARGRRIIVCDDEGQLPQHWRGTRLKTIAVKMDYFNRRIRHIPECHKPGSFGESRHVRSLNSYVALERHLPMRPDQFVSYLRAECLDGLVQTYRHMFAGTPTENFTDASMRELAEFWKSVDMPTQELQAKFIRLGSQSTLASVLAVLEGTLR